MNQVGSVKAGYKTVGADQPLRLDRRFVLFSLLAAMLLSWPLLAFGRPSYIQDSAAYYKGGKAAVAFVQHKLDSPEIAGADAGPGGAVSSSGPPAAHAAKQASGVRSVTYSVAAYLLAGPGSSLLFLVFAQALATGTIIVTTLGALGGGLPTRRTIASLVLLAGATTAAPATFLAVPDIFAGLLIASMVLLTVALRRLSPAIRLLCVGIAAFAVTAHASHIPIAVGMTALGLGWVAIRRYYQRPLPPRTWAWIVAPLALGGLTTLAVNQIAFGEASLTSKRYPFALARSVNDGPARWYLEEHCPELKYTICTLYPHGLPEGGALQFLWGKDGVVERATPEQLDRIRDEEADVVLAAAREYAGFEARRLSFNVLRQLVSFRPYPFIERLTVDQTGTPQLEPAPQPDERILFIVGILAAISAAIGAIWLGWAFVARPSFRATIALMFLGLLGNAVTCAVLSAVANRYQARVVWLIPLFALALWGSPLNRSNRDHSR